MNAQQLSDAVAGHGWRLVLGRLRTTVAAEPATVARLVAAVLAAAEPDPGRVALDVRPGLVVVSVLPAEEVDLAAAITDAVTALGLDTEPGPAAGSIQQLEIAIDALDPAAIRPFWRAVLGYIDDPEEPPQWASLIDPLKLAPAVWFQPMDAPRPQRNRIHLDISVPHDLAAARIDAALAAGGRISYEAHAPAWWVLADPEGNEACISTWQNRD